MRLDAYSPTVALGRHAEDAMDVLVLRLIHIGAGAFWVGAVFTFVVFVQPAAAAIGPDGAKFMYQLIHHRRLSVAMLSAAVVTVLAGIWLLLITSNGLDPDLLFDGARLGYTVGGVAAILTLGVGGLYVFPRTKIVERTIGGMLAEGRPPTPDEQQTLARVGGESRRAGWIVLLGLTIAVTAMATARLWPLIL
jgi:uncharacterized membrane protein